MISFDTNLVVYSCNADAPECAPARRFLESLAKKEDVLVCELMLAEVYLKIRNPRIFSRPYDAASAAAYCQTFRRHPRWALVESAAVMDQVWRLAGQPDFAMRRIIDARLALTLIHHGVTEFATANIKDFQQFGFTKVWNPLEGEEKRGE
jgi:uncharacterized protein